MTAWPIVPLDEIVKPAERWEAPMTGVRYRQLGVRLWGEGAYERESMDGSGTKYSKLNRVRAGDLVVNKIWARNGSVAVVPDSLDNCYVSGEFPTFAPLSDRVDSRWLHWLTKTKPFWEQCDERSRGTSGKNRIRPEEFLSIVLPLPAVEEQRRIVGRIECLMEQVRDAEALKRQADDATGKLFPSVLASAFDQEHTGWQRCRVQDAVLSMDAGWSPQCVTKPAGFDEWGVLRTTSVQWGVFQPLENKTLPPGFAPRQELGVKAGDVLVTRAGPRKRVGVVAMVAADYPFLMISDKLIRLRPDTNQICPEFLAYALCSPYSQEYFVQRKTGLADAQVNISQAILGATPVMFPRSLDEQYRIVREVQQVHATSQLLNRGNRIIEHELESLVRSVLNSAFTGTM
jgi:type I restriction enzyme S subunit